MSKHRESPEKFVPPESNLPQTLPPNYPQPVDWFSETERLRVEQDRTADTNPDIFARGHDDQEMSFPETFIPRSHDDQEMSFEEIGRRLNISRQVAYYTFKCAMTKLAQLQDTKLLRELHALAQLRQAHAHQRQIILPGDGDE